MTIPDFRQGDETPANKEDEFAQRLLRWYAAAYRDLPWRRTRDPYAIWISETMLQQTQVATVIPYWTRWQERFPTVADLAAAPLQDVLSAWAGLGYYARARNLHRAAQAIVEQHHGVFPATFEDVLALPGVGRYTAGAVCSIAFGQDVPVVDANVIRVLCRVFGVHGDPKSSAVQDRLWDLADRLVVKGRAAEFNQAIMEHGALICHRSPRCERCPVSDLCYAYRSGDPTSLPEFAPRPEFSQQTDVCAIVRDAGDRFLLVQRPPEGLWGGLWEFPRVTKAASETETAAAERAAREIVGVAVQAGDRIASLKHGVTTRRITLAGYRCDPEGTPAPQALGCAGWAWTTAERLADYPLASPQRRLAAKIVASPPQLTLFDGG